MVDDVRGAEGSHVRAVLRGRGRDDGIARVAGVFGAEAAAGGGAAVEEEFEIFICRVGGRGAAICLGRRRERRAVELQVVREDRVHGRLVDDGRGRVRERGAGEQLGARGGESDGVVLVGAVARVAQAFVRAVDSDLVAGREGGHVRADGLDGAGVRGA